MGPNIHLQIGITVVLMLCMYKPLFYMVKDVVMGSVFCVTNWIVALAAKGVYADVLVKKRRYWLKSVPRDLVDRDFLDKQVGFVGMLESAT